MFLETQTIQKSGKEAITYLLTNTYQKMMQQQQYRDQVILLQIFINCQIRLLLLKINYERNSFVREAFLRKSVRKEKKLKMN
jgi:hypothetical protein